MQFLSCFANKGEIIIIIIVIIITITSKVSCVFIVLAVQEADTGGLRPVCSTELTNK